MPFRRMWEAKGFGIFDGEVMLESNRDDLARFFGIGYEDVFMVFRKRKIETYYETTHMKKESTHGQRFFNDTAKLKWIYAQEKKLFKKAISIAKDARKLNLSLLTKKQLSSKLDHYIRAFQEVYGLYHTTQPQCFETFNQEIRNELHKMRVDELEVFLELSTPHAPSIIAREDIDRKRMYISFLKGKEKLPLVQKHLNKYRYLHASEGSRAWEEKNILDDFKKNKLTISELTHEVEQQEQLYHKIKKRQKEIIKKNKISGDLQRKFAVLRHFGNSRLEIRYAWSALVWPYVKIADEISARINVPYPRFGDLQIREIKNALLKEKMVSNKELKERFDYSVLLMKNKKISVLSGKKAKEFFAKQAPKEMKVNFVKGMIASKGIVNGVVKVIRFDENIAEQMQSMKQGQILVVGQTRPMLMPAIRKAAAIVADEGGITSHAAIVSREFGIPCIVGTHNATRIFKNGDKIIVDANQGIAKKISKY